MEEWRGGNQLQQHLIGDADVVQTITGANGSLAIATNVPSETDPRRPIVHVVTEKGRTVDPRRAGDRAKMSIRRKYEAIQEPRAAIGEGGGIQARRIEIAETIFYIHGRT